MIIGIGTDIVKVERFEKWVKNPKILERFFNKKEFWQGEITAQNLSHVCQHYAARFAAKEAFSKALGTGLVGFDLSDVYIKKYKNGKPELVLENKALEILKKKCTNMKVLVSLSHEKEFALAFVVIEN